MDRELIRLEDVCFSYPAGSETDTAEPEEALRGISLSIRAGEYISVIGKNGSGKSTLAKLLNLILLPTAGNLIIDGETIPHEDAADDLLVRMRRKIGMVFQNPDDQLVATVVDEDVAFGPENLGVPHNEIIRRVGDALAAVGMEEYAKQAPHKLSGGQKQRVAIAGVLAMKPDCIIFDESTAMLDPSGRNDVLLIMEKLCREDHITVIHITHHMSEAIRADRTVILNEGKVVMDASPREVFRSVEKIRSLGLEVPQGADLIDRLRARGLPLPEGCLTEDECVRALSDWLKGVTGK